MVALMREKKSICAGKPPVEVAKIGKCRAAGEMDWMPWSPGWDCWLDISPAGAALAYLGDLNRRFAAQIDFFSRINATMQVDQGLAESLRLFSMSLQGPSARKKRSCSTATPI